MIVKLPTEHCLEFLSLKGGCTGSYESTLVKFSNCWKSHVTAQLLFFDQDFFFKNHWETLPESWRNSFSEMSTDELCWLIDTNQKTPR